MGAMKELYIELVEKTMKEVADQGGLPADAVWEAAEMLEVDFDIDSYTTVRILRELTSKGYEPFMNCFEDTYNVTIK